jgi:hypothetical protein
MSALGQKLGVTAAQIRAIRKHEAREAKLAIAALNSGDTAGFIQHAEEARVLGSWLRVYA